MTTKTSSSKLPDSGHFAKKLKLSPDSVCLAESCLVSLRHAKTVIRCINATPRKFWPVKSSQFPASSRDLPDDLLIDCATGQLYEPESGVCLSSANLRLEPEKTNKDNS